MAADYQYQRISALLGDQIPDYVQEFYPLFVIFVTKYFEYLESNSTSVTTSIQSLRLNRDIDTTANDLAVQFLNMYVPDLPNTFSVDRSLLIKHFRNFYQRKGSLQSFQFFFRSFFNDDIEIVYPRDQLFNTSGGRWYVERNLVVRATSGQALRVAHTYVTGQTSLASAIVDAVVQLSGNDADPRYTLIMQPDSVRGTFVSGETVRAIYYGAHDVDGTTSASSVVTLQALAPLQTLQGRYTDTRSHLSDSQLLQDSLYYQQFSYVIRSRQDRSVWADHVLRMLHPAGSIMFNEWRTNQEPEVDSSFTRLNSIETTVQIPTIKVYLPVPTFTFDRTADLQTGTSVTRVANGTGFTTAAYTSIGSITYDADYDYPGEHITWALQKIQDNIVPVTEIVRPDGAMFDKLNRSVELEDQLIAWPQNVNSSVSITRRTLASSNLTAGTALTSFTVSLASNTQGSGSVILLLTWHKTSQGNHPLGESSNAVVVSFSSNSTVVPYFGTETQRNYRRIALNRSLEYPNLIFYSSSNSVSSAVVTPDAPWSSFAWIARAGTVVFRPYNWERGVTYDRCAIRFDLDTVQQLNTSLTESFSTSNYNIVGLVTSSQGIQVSSVANYGFTSTLTGSFYSFSSGAFVFNAASTSSRFVQSRVFNSSTELRVSVRYIVGDGFNGGNIPDLNEDLELQRSFDAVNWTSVTKIWIGGSSNTWIFGNQILTGTANTTPGNATVTGVAALFSNELQVGDFININTSGSASTAYTVATVVNSNEITVSPVPVNTFNNVSVFRKLPANQQFRTTSILVATGLPNTSMSVRIIQLSPSTTPLNEDLYAITDFTVNSWRNQDTTGTVNIGVAVSSNSTLRINDLDFFDVTTIGG